MADRKVLHDIERNIWFYEDEVDVDDIVEWKSEEYKRNRILAYKDLGSFDEQLDMQYWDQVNSTTIWKDAITEIKAKYPKDMEYDYSKTKPEPKGGE